MWIGQHETGRYSKAHAHGSAAVLICLSGKGYTYTWPAKLGTHPWEKGTTEEIKDDRTTNQLAWSARRR